MSERTSDDEELMPDDSEEEVDPTVVKVDKSLLELFLLGGIDRKWCLANIAIVAIFAVMLKSWLMLAAAPLTHLALYLAVKSDPDAFRAYRRYSKQGDFYEPRQVLGPGENGRPVGFGRAMPC